MATWWRRNRLALLLLPLALVVALAAASSRIETYWWSPGFHRAAEADDGVVRLVDPYDDGYLTYVSEATYSLVGVTPATPEDLGGDTLPEGLTAWQVTLDVQADPDVVLTGCSIALIDEEGARYRAEDATSHDGHSWARSTCVPAETPGPSPVFGSTERPERKPGTEPRPERFRTTTIVVTPTEVSPTAVRIWYRLPRYAELTL